MTPKEKADEIFNKMAPFHPVNEDEKKLAKHCAIACVDEIISACEYNHVESHNTDWWNKVKTEIEKTA